MWLGAYVVALSLMFAAVVLSLGALLPGCASLSEYERQHPDVVAKAEMAVQVASCVDNAVQRYQAANAAKVTITDVQIRPIDAGRDAAKLDPNPYLTWEQMIDGGAPPAPEGSP